jgi:hypothetical protein
MNTRTSLLALVAFSAMATTALSPTSASAWGNAGHFVERKNPAAGPFAGQRPGGHLPGPVARSTPGMSAPSGPATGYGGAPNPAATNPGPHVPGATVPPMGGASSMPGCHNAWCRPHHFGDGSSTPPANGGVNGSGPWNQGGNGQGNGQGGNGPWNQGGNGQGGNGQGGNTPWNQGGNGQGGNGGGWNPGEHPCGYGGCAGGWPRPWWRRPVWGPNGYPAQPTVYVPSPTYTTPAPTYTAPAPTYTTAAPTYTAPAPTYTTAAPTYTAPTPTYTAPAPTYTPPSTYTQAPAQPVSQSCNCLTKSYMQDGSVVFTDVCTKEAAMAAPAGSPQGQSAQQTSY